MSAAPAPEERLRILYVTSNTEDVGGADLCLLQLASEMRAGGHAVQLLARCDNRLRGAYAAAGVPVTLHPFFRPTKRGGPLALAGVALRTLGALAWFIRYYRRARPDIVHVNDLIDLIPAIAARLAGFPVVYHLRTITGGERQRRLMSWLIRHAADVSISTSGAVRDHYLLSGRTGRHRALVLYDWADPNFLLPSPARECPPPLRAAARRVVMLGRVARWKGQHVFIAAAAALRDRFPDVGWFVIGGLSSDPVDADYVAMVKAQAATSGVALLGDRRDVAALLGWADISVHASTTPEPFGLVVLESLMRGVATIGADAGGVRDMITDGSTGLLTPPGDVPALARAIASLLEAPERCRSLAAAGQAHARSKFDRGALVQRFREMYRDCVAGRGAPAAAEPRLPAPSLLGGRGG
jgi:glycosyltransferase involved in cell wall biosynthesis